MAEIAATNSAAKIPKTILLQDYSFEPPTASPPLKINRLGIGDHVAS